MAQRLSTKWPQLNTVYSHSCFDQTISLSFAVVPHSHAIVDSYLTWVFGNIAGARVGVGLFQTHKNGSTTRCTNAIWSEQQNERQKIKIGSKWAQNWAKIGSKSRCTMPQSQSYKRCRWIHQHSLHECHRVRTTQIGHDSLRKCHRATTGKQCPLPKMNWHAWIRWMMHHRHSRSKWHRMSRIRYMRVRIHE